MIRKDYERLARALRHANKEIELDEDIYPRALLVKIVGFISQELKDENPRFSSDRFYNAVFMWED